MSMQSAETYCPYCGVPSSVLSPVLRRCDKHLYAGNSWDYGGFGRYKEYLVDRRNLGFTHDDVKLCRDIADSSGSWTDENREALSRLASRIAALLVLVLLAGCTTTVRSRQAPEVPATFPMRTDTTEKP